MLIEGRCDEQSDFQARSIEEEESLNPGTAVNDTRGKTRCRSCGGLCPHTRKIVLQGIRHAITAAKEIISPQFVVANRHAQIHKTQHQGKKANLVGLGLYSPARTRRFFRH